MKRFFKGQAFGTVLVLSLALGGGLLGAGCGDNKDEGGTAGSGGIGGSGGTGGTGATGGTGGSGGSGGSGGTVDTGFETRECSEFADCEDEGAECQGLTCQEDINGSLTWLRSCDTSADCGIDFTFCLGTVTGGEFPFCWFNLCDANSLFADSQTPIINGTFFDKCDTQRAGADLSEASTGTCLPFENGGTIVGFCSESGTSPAGGDCRPDELITGNPANRCEQGAACLSSSASQGKCSNNSDCRNGTKCFVPFAGAAGQCLTPCTNDAGCANGEYCDPDGFCADVGFCADTCNTGTATRSLGQYGDCAIPQDECLDISPGIDQSQVPADLGYCAPLCEMFDATACAAVDGTERYCHPLFDAGAGADQLAGICLDQTTEQTAIGDECSPAFDGGSAPNPCVDGAICTDHDDDAATNPRCVAFCDCAEGFAANGECPSAATQCLEGQTCVNIRDSDPATGEPENTRIGFCVDAQ